MGHPPVVRQNTRLYRGGCAMSSISSIRRIALTAVVAFAVLSCHSLLSQASEASSTHDDVVAQLSGAENHWRATVVDPKTQHDSVPPSIREARNILWKPLLELTLPSECVALSWAGFEDFYFSSWWSWRWECGNRLYRFPRFVGREGNSTIVFLAFHEPSFPRPASIRLKLRRRSLSQLLPSLARTRSG
jgi:hypothetical protein